MTEKERKTARVPTFDGESSNCQMWWVRFKAHVKMSGLDKWLKPTIESETPASQEEAENLDETNATDKNKLKAVKRNDEAIANLTLAFTTNDLLNKTMSTQEAY